MKDGAKTVRGTNVLEEDLENTTSLLIDETRNTLHTSTTSETADGGLCNT
jgi:hypothetical protein